MPAAVFQMEDNKWHYIVINVNKETMKIYDNGKLLSNVNTFGAVILNSDLNLTVGNINTLDGHFRGYIRELEISNGNKVESEIISLGQKLDTQLNNPK